ncbi:MAG: carboxypeptidase-like regulatory domain-containing protein [Myxococcota bacterium]
MSEQAQGGATRWRWLLLVGVLALAAAWMAWRCDSPPPGVDDEVDAPGLTQKVPIGAEASAGEIHGRVLFEATLDPEAPWADPALTPATGCTVQTWQAGTRVAEAAGCDAQGRFVATLNPDVQGRVSVEIEAPGRLRAVVTVDLPEDGRGTLPDVALGLGQTVSGVVVDGRGAGVPGVVVQARPNPGLGEPEPWRRTTDEHGAFSFDSLPPGPVTLRASPEGFDPTVVQALAPSADVLLRLDRLYDVRGRVRTDGTGLDAAAAQVRLEGSGVWPARSVAVEPDGTFEVPSVPDGVYALEAVVAGEPDEPAFASVPLEGVEPDLDVTLALVPAHWIPVRVEGPDGEPVADARVSVMNAQIGLLGRAAQADAIGMAFVGPVVPGPYVVRADADGMLASVPEPVQVEDGSPQTVVLRLRTPATIVATVILSDGTPVSGASVSLRTDAAFSIGEAQTRAATFARTLEAAGSLGVTRGPVPAVPLGDGDAALAFRSSGDSGAVVFSDLIPGVYRVRARDAAHADSDEQTVEVSAGDRERVTLTLRSGHRVTGRVRNDNDQPLPDVLVRVEGRVVAQTDDRGVFDAGPHAGRVTLEARAAGYARARETVRVRDAPVDVELVLAEADARISGRVSGGNGRPVEGARVSVHPVDGASRSAWTDEKGVWSFEDLAPGRAALEVEHPDYVPHERAVQIDRETVADVRLVEGWATTVVVRWRGTLEPVEGARVRGGGSDAVADARGDAALRGLARDAVAVTVSAAGAPSVSTTLRRAKDAGGEVFVELAEGGSLTGSVTDYRGDAVRGATVEVFLPGEDTPDMRVRVGRRGRFRFDGLPEGDVVLRATPPAALEEDMVPDEMNSDVLRGHVTRDVQMRLDRR